MSTTRQPGYYWVKLKEPPYNHLADDMPSFGYRPGWRIAKYIEPNVWETVCESQLPDIIIAEINETRIPSPDEGSSSLLGEQIALDFQKKILKMDKAAYEAYEDIKQQQSWIGKYVPLEIMIYIPPTVTKYSDGTTITVFRSEEHKNAWELYLPDHIQ